MIRYILEVFSWGTDWCDGYGYTFHLLLVCGSCKLGSNDGFFVTKEVVDEVFINLPSEDYNISELVSEFESMGIDVSVNLNAFNFASLGTNGFEKLGD